MRWINRTWCSVPGNLTHNDSVTFPRGLSMCQFLTVINKIILPGRKISRFQGNKNKPILSVCCGIWLHTQGRPIWEHFGMSDGVGRSCCKWGRPLVCVCTWDMWYLVWDSWDYWDIAEMILYLLAPCFMFVHIPGTQSVLEANDHKLWVNPPPGHIGWLPYLD